MIFLRASSRNILKIIFFSFFHFKSQLRDLLEKHPEKHVELLEIIQKFRDDEMDHHDTGLKMGAEQVCLFI